MKVNVLLFAKLREIAGTESVELDLPEGAVVGSVLQSIYGDDALAERASRSVMFAINQSYVRPDTVLSDGDELAIIPPVAGG